MSVYMLHLFETFAVYENGRRVGQPCPSQHYIGYVSDGPGNLVRRLEQHAAGNGSKMVRAAVERGVGFELVRVWYGGSRALERYLKRRRDGKDLCPVCSPNRRMALHVEGDYEDVYRKTRVHVSFHRKRLVRPRTRFRWSPPVV